MVNGSLLGDSRLAEGPGAGQIGRMPKALRFALRIAEEIALWFLGGLLMWLGLDPESFFRWLFEPSGVGVTEFLSSNHARWLFVLSSISIIAIASFVSLKRHADNRNNDIPMAFRHAKPDYDAWAGAPELTLGQAACLWTGVEPQDEIPSGAPSIRFQILKMAMARGLLKPTFHFPDIIQRDMLMRGFSIDPKTITPGVMVPRAELLRWARRVRERPRFLFKRRWWSLWTYSTPR